MTTRFGVPFLLAVLLAGCASTGSQINYGLNHEEAEALERRRAGLKDP